MKKQHEGKRILGVKIRGTDYTTTKPSGHPVQPDPEQAIAKAKEAMQEKGFEWVYLSCEDKRIIAKFQEAFGEKLILPDAEYVDYDYSNTKGYSNWLFNKKNPAINAGLSLYIT